MQCLYHAVSCIFPFRLSHHQCVVHPRIESRGVGRLRPTYTCVPAGAGMHPPFLRREREGAQG